MRIRSVLVRPGRISVTRIAVSARSARSESEKPCTPTLLVVYAAMVGINLILASLLSLLHNSWWLAFTGFVGGAMVWFAATGFCIMANGLYWLGAQPRLAPGPVAAPAHGGRVPAG